MKKKKKELNWSYYFDAIQNKSKGAKGHASIKRDKRQALELARIGKRKLGL
jgi:hypothetical protein